MVNLRTDGIHGLMKCIQGKKMVCFGAGKHFDTVMNLYASYELAKHVAYVLDNDIRLHGSVKTISGNKFEIISLAELKKRENVKNIVVLITSHIYSMEIVTQLDREEALSGVDVYVGSFLSEVSQDVPDFCIEKGGLVKIPKVIHYCWFGKEEIPPAYRNYMKSWKKFCPDYEIKRWDETNFDITINKYMHQAYKEKKWAFVSDYARLKILYDYGGIYLDCDVELLKNLDIFLSEDMFCGFEDNNHINLGLGFGAIAKHPYLKSLMDYYDMIKFVNEDGSLNLIPCPAYQTNMAKEYGLQDNNTFQCLNGITVFPTVVFSPISSWGRGEITGQSYSIHHYCASWQSKENMKELSLMYQRYCSRIGGK